MDAYAALDRDNGGLPLSLQDMCMLCIMLCLEEFPTDSLALLPSAIRRRLFFGLAHADLLHVDTEVLFGDLNLDTDREHNDRQRGPAVAREELLNYIFHKSQWLRPFTSSFFSLCLEAALDCYQWVKSAHFDLIEHICQCYPSLEPTMVPLCSNQDFFLPKRFLQFVSWKLVHGQHYKLEVPLELAQPLIKYCKFPPKHLRIDCYDFQKCMLRDDSLICLRKKTIEKMDPVIPFLQELLSSVEVLELVTGDGYECLDKYTITVPYVILYNIVTSSQPRLKHLKINGVPFVTNWGLELTFELFLKKKLPSVFGQYTSVPFASSLPDPYPLKGLSVIVPNSTFPWNYAHDQGNMISLYAQSLASKLQSLVAFHMYTLKHVKIRGISFRYANDSIDGQDFQAINVPALATLLSSSFTQLLKQPQFRSLSVGVSPLSGACALIETFLTTPASHKQTLYVEGLDEQDLMEREVTSDEGTFVVKRQKITKQRTKLPERKSFFPETNAQFKCLDLGHSSSCIHSLLFSLPELKLKRLRMRTQDMTLVPADTVIKVEQVVFSTQTRTSYKQTISPAHLEKFTTSNPALRRLVFEHPTEKNCSPGLISALIYCLSKLYQQGRGLDKLALHSVKFDCTDIREFFTTMRDLSHQHGTTLVLTQPYYNHRSFRCWCRGDLFADLGKDFQETKIKKIVCNMTDRCTDPHPQLSPLAEEVVVNYRRYCW